MNASFGSKDLVACLLCLGFSVKKSTGSSHIKYSSNRPCKIGQRSFIEVILNRKVFDKHTKSSYLRQIRNLGYTLDEMNTCMFKKRNKKL